MVSSRLPAQIYSLIFVSLAFLRALALSFSFPPSSSCCKLGCLPPPPVLVPLPFSSCQPRPGSSRLHWRISSSYWPRQLPVVIPPRVLIGWSVHWNASHMQIYPALRPVALLTERISLSLTYNTNELNKIYPAVMYTQWNTNLRSNNTMSMYNFVFVSITPPQAYIIGSESVVNRDWWKKPRIKSRHSDVGQPMAWQKLDKFPPSYKYSAKALIQMKTIWCREPLVGNLLFTFPEAFCLFHEICT